MLEDYAINMRISRAEWAGRYELTSSGKRKEVTVYRELYRTNAGELYPEEWKRRVRKQIEKEDQTDLLKKIKQHCREHCAWLRKESEIEEYAMQCLCSRAYEYWTDFKNELEIIWM